MQFQTEVSRALDDEHRRSLVLIDRVAHAFAKAVPLDKAPDPELATMASELARHVQQEIDRHFAFEERLFPMLQEMGEGDIGPLLVEEHDAIRAVMAELSPLAQEAAAGTLDLARWSVLRRTVLELLERLRAHIDKETMALLPLIDDLLDESVDSELAMQYAES
jgi:hemerythrin-like domain-containing protein